MLPSMFQEIWLVRHGETASNRDGIVQGQLDVPLSATGECQATALGRWLSSHEVIFDRLITSTLIRTKQTADRIADELGPRTPPNRSEDPAWMEGHYGEFEGRDITALRAFRERHGADAAIVPPAGGESMREMGLRALRAYNKLCSEPGERALVVTHGGPIAAIVCHVLSISHEPPVLGQFRRDNTGYTVLRRRSNGAWQLTTINATPHLV